MAYTLLRWRRPRRAPWIVLGFALIQHILVALSGSLIPAFLTHALYELGLGWSIQRAAARFDRERGIGIDRVATP